MNHATKFYLCGTVHTDLNGPERLQKVIDFVKPDVIAIEVHASKLGEHVQFHQRMMRSSEDEMRREVAEIIGAYPWLLNSETTVRFARSLRYEIWTAMQYAAETGVQVVALENKIYTPSPGVKEKIRLLLERSPEDLEACTENLYGWNEECKRNFNECAERNEIWAEKLKPLKGRVLVPAGASHIFGPSLTLPELLDGRELMYFKLPDFHKLEEAE